MLDRTEIDRLQSFLKNRQLLEAVRKVFTETIEKTNPSLDITDDDNLMGQKYRAFLTSRDILNKCFDHLLAYEKEEKKKEVFRKER